jgi:quinol-cytochrome oxidoreductase complex cytochrome b subunit
MITKFQIRRLLSIAVVLFLASALLDALLQRHMVSADTVTRLMGVLKGIILMICANEVPKRLPPLARMYCDPARDLAYRRLIGWLAVAAGVVFTLAYALAPLPIARNVGIGVLVLLLLVVVCMMTCVVWTRFSNRRRTS